MAQEKTVTSYYPNFPIAEGAGIEMERVFVRTISHTGNPESPVHAEHSREAWVIVKGTVKEGPTAWDDIWKFQLTEEVAEALRDELHLVRRIVNAQEGRPDFRLEAVGKVAEWLTIGYENHAPPVGFHFYIEFRKNGRTMKSTFAEIGGLGSFESAVRACLGL